MYRITLENGFILDSLELNGNNFISNDVVSDDIFNNNLNSVEISDGENAHIYNDMILVANRVYNGQSWFILAEKTPEQKEKELLETTITDLQLALVEMYETILSGGM
jgi:hypothetical protein